MAEKPKPEYHMRAWIITEEKGKMVRRAAILSFSVDQFKFLGEVEQ